MRPEYRFKFSTRIEYEKLKDTKYKNYIEIDYDDMDKEVTLIHKDDYKKLHNNTEI